MYESDADDDECKPWRAISTAECFVILLLCLPVDIFFTQVKDEPFRGFVAALSTGAIMALIWILRPLRRNPIFWACIGGLCAAHVVLVAALPYTGDFRFGFALFPIVALDIYLSGRLIIFACGARFQAD